MARRHMSDIAGRLFPASFVGSYPRPNWYSYNLRNRDIVEALQEEEFAEAYKDGLRAQLGDQEEVGLDILADRRNLIVAPEALRQVVRGDHFGEQVSIRVADRPDSRPETDPGRGLSELAEVQEIRIERQPRGRGCGRRERFRRDLPDADGLQPINAADVECFSLDE